MLQIKSVMNTSCCAYALNELQNKNLQSQSGSYTFANVQEKQFSSFEQDKFNIVFSDAFKRLANKTQVFDNRHGSDGHKYRTRLTHSLEVANLSSYVANALGLNSLAAEILGMLHDIGHPPFGHIGQDALDELLSDSTNGKERFEHNNQAVRLVSIIEPLNISHVLLDGLKKRPEHGLTTPFNYGESQVMNICDAISYVSGDTQDALETGALHPRDLLGNPFISMCFGTDDKFKQIEMLKDTTFVQKSILVFLTQNLIQESLKRFKQHKLTSYFQFFEETLDGKPLVALSDEVFAKLSEYKKFLFKHVYNTEPMQSIREQQKVMLFDVFNFFYKTFELSVLDNSQESIQYVESNFNVNNPSEMIDYIKKENNELTIGKNYLQRYKHGEVSKERTIIDYLAGCDDKYIFDIYQSVTEFNRLFKLD